MLVATLLAGGTLSVAEAKDLALLNSGRLYTALLGTTGYSGQAEMSRQKGTAATGQRDKQRRRLTPF